MGKGGIFKFSLFAALGALAGYASYMASKDEFSDDTKDKFDKVLNKIKGVGTDIQRTYTAIGDKDSFKSSTKTLGNSTLKLAEKAGDLVKAASTDMYKHAAKYVKSTINKMTDADNSGEYDDLDASYMKKGKSKAKKSPKKLFGKKRSTKKK